MSNKVTYALHVSAFWKTTGWRVEWVSWDVKLWRSNVDHRSNIETSLLKYVKILSTLAKLCMCGIRYELIRTSQVWSILHPTHTNTHKHTRLPRCVCALVREVIENPSITKTAFQKCCAKMGKIWQRDDHPRMTPSIRSFYLFFSVKWPERVE